MFGTQHVVLSVCLKKAVKLLLCWHSPNGCCVCLLSVPLSAVDFGNRQIPYQVEIVRGCVDNDSIGALLCRRAEQLNAAVLLMAKHSRGAIKEVREGWIIYTVLHTLYAM